MQKLNHCCGFELHTGGLIIGSLEVIGGLVGTIICSVVLVLLRDELDQKSAVKMFSTRNEDGLLAQHECPISYLMAFVVVLLIISVFQMVISFLLIHAIQKKSSEFLTSWMVFKIIFIIFVVFILVSSILHSFPLKMNLFYLGIIVLTTLYLDVIYALQHKIKAEANELPTYADIKREPQKFLQHNNY